MNVKHLSFLNMMKIHLQIVKRLKSITTEIIIGVVFLVAGEIIIPAVFAQDNITITMNKNLSSINNTTLGNASSIAGIVAETEILPSAGETGYSDDGPGTYERGGGQVFDP